VQRLFRPATEPRIHGGCDDGEEDRQIDRQELDPDGAIEHQVADDADDLGQHEAGDDSPDKAEKATAIALIPIPLEHLPGRAWSILSTVSVLWITSQHLLWSLVLHTAKVQLNRLQRHRPEGRFGWFIGVHSGLMERASAAYTAGDLGFYALVRGLAMGSLRVPPQESALLQPEG
jgi:hypothetical protein